MNIICPQCENGILNSRKDSLVCPKCEKVYSFSKTEKGILTSCFASMTPETKKVRFYSATVKVKDYKIWLFISKEEFEKFKDKIGQTVVVETYSNIQWLEEES